MSAKGGIGINAEIFYRELKYKIINTDLLDFFVYD